MLYEQDYIIRVVRQAIQVLAKLLLGLESDELTSAFVKDTTQREELEALLKRIDAGEIREAERELDELFSQGSKADLQIKLVFYTYLNEKSESFLDAHGACRADLRDALLRLSGEEGVRLLAETLLTF